MQISVIRLLQIISISIVPGKTCQLILYIRIYFHMFTTVTLLKPHCLILLFYLFHYTIHSLCIPVLCVNSEAIRQIPIIDVLIVACSSIVCIHSISILSYVNNNGSIAVCYLPNIPHARRKSHYFMMLFFHL